MMEIKFTKKQYENLIKLVYLGNWMIKRKFDQAIWNLCSGKAFALHSNKFRSI